MCEFWFRVAAWVSWVLAVGVIRKGRAYRVLDEWCLKLQYELCSLLMRTFPFIGARIGSVKVATRIS